MLAIITSTTTVLLALISAISRRRIDELQAKPTEIDAHDSLRRRLRDAA